MLFGQGTLGFRLPAFVVEGRLHLRLLSFD